MGHTLEQVRTPQTYEQMLNLISNQINTKQSQKKILFHTHQTGKM